MKPNLTQEELLWKIYESTEKTRKYILWGKIFSFLKILVIIILFVLAIIYLLPYVEKILVPYQELLQTNKNGQDILKNINLEDLFKQYK